MAAERHNRSHWKKVIQDLRSSGLTQKAYAKKKKLNFFSIQYWARQFPSKAQARAKAAARREFVVDLAPLSKALGQGPCHEECLKCSDVREAATALLSTMLGQVTPV